MNGAILDRLIRGLRFAGFEFTAEDLADAFWLAPLLSARGDVLARLEEAIRPDSEPATARESRRYHRRPTLQAQDKAVRLLLPTASSRKESMYSCQQVQRHCRRRYMGCVRLPDVAGLPDALALARSMRPFRRRQETTRFYSLDEAKTAERLAASDIWLPFLTPGYERG